MSEALRRPLHSPALGIPDMWPSFARAKAVQALVGNKKWTTNAAPVVSVANTTIIAATLSMTALVTGRFRVRASGVISLFGIGNEVVLGVSHGTGVIVPEYSQPAVFVPNPTGEGTMGIEWCSLIVDYSSAPISFTAAVGSTTALNLTLTCNTATMEFETHGLQFEAEEF